MSLLTLEKRPLHVSHLSNHTPVLGCRGKLTTLKRKKLQILKAMSRLTTVLMDIEDVLTETDLHMEADMHERKRPRLSNERGIDHQTVLASQIERCQKQSTNKGVVSNITNNRNSRKRPREDDDEFNDNSNDSFEIVIRNNFGGQREEILSCFDCRKLIDALLSKSDSSFSEKEASENRRKSSRNYHRNVSDVRCETEQQNTGLHVNKNRKEKSPAKKPSNKTQKEKFDQHKGQDVHKQKSKEKKSSKQDKATTKHKNTKNKENVSPSIIDANNNVYQEIMNNKCIKTEPDTASVLSERTKELYEILAGN